MRGEFRFSDEHLALLQNFVISYSTIESGTPTVEPSIPYGTTDMYADVARILNIAKEGEELSSDQKTRIDKLHRETGKP